MSCASQLSIQCKMPASGAVSPKRINSQANGAPVLTAATASAPRIPTPIKSATRPMPEATTIANSRAHGLMMRARLISVAAAPIRAAAAAVAVGASGPRSVASSSRSAPVASSSSSERDIVAALLGLRAH